MDVATCHLLVLTAVLSILVAALRDAHGPSGSGASGLSAANSMFLRLLDPTA